MKTIQVLSRGNQQEERVYLPAKILSVGIAWISTEGEQWITNSAFVNVQKHIIKNFVQRWEVTIIPTQPVERLEAILECKTLDTK